MGIEEDELLELIDKILKTELFKHRVVRGEDVCSFADIIVRDVAYEEVSPFRRRKLHNSVGCALEKAYVKKIDEHLGELASHFLEGGDKDKALGYFLKAGDKAAKIYANAEATSYFQSALKLLEEREDEFREKGRVLEMLGDIKKLVGEYDACLKYWNDGLLVWGRLDEKGNISRLHRKIANVLWEDIGDAEKAKVHHEEALKILEAQPESSELASLYEDMARMYGRTESQTKALDWAQKALELAKRLNDHAAIASSYVSLGEFTLTTSGDWKKSAECNEKALKIALDNGLMETAIEAYDSLANAIPWKEQERCIDCFEKGFELAKKVGAIRWVSRLGAILASLYSIMGMSDKAVLLAEESVSIDRKTGNTPNLSFSLGVLGYAYLVLGEWDKSEQCFIEELDLARKLDQYQRIATSSLHLSYIYTEKGDLPKARQLAEGAIGILEKGGAKLNQMLSSITLGYRYVELGMLQEASNLINTMDKFFLDMKEEGWIAWVETLRAMVLRAQKKWEQSIEHFEKSRQLFEEINARRWMTYSYARFFLCEYARVYLERAKEGDKEKAHSLLDQALEIFQKIGAKKDIDRTMRLVETLHLAPTQIHEKGVSPESHEYTELVGNVIATPHELKVGESLELEIELTNTCKAGAILLTKITEVIPEGFTMAKKPEFYRMEGNCLNMKEKQLDPLKKEEVKLVLTPRIQGTFHVKPRIVYLDENGKEKTCEPEPVSVTVKELGIKGWLKGER